MKTQGTLNFVKIPGLILLIFFMMVHLSWGQSQSTDELYQCLPCGGDCDEATYKKPGSCSHCGMALVRRSSVGFRNISPAEICSYIEKHPSAILLDVRTKPEYEGRRDNYGTLKNAINIPIQELERRIAELEGYREHEIIVYCSHSRRSPQASYMLAQRGFKNVTNMSGGMSVLKDNSCKK